eukprot:4035338-Pyramimonas_sp.AAC.1
MPHPLMRLALPPGLCPIRSCDWLPLRVYAPSAHAIGPIHSRWSRMATRKWRASAGRWAPSLR